MQNSQWLQNSIFHIHRDKVSKFEEIEYVIHYVEFKMHPPLF